ncbi:MAG: hypothetical protein IAE89_10855 [Anaerolineae bacterium]|nr:hypothetical protein [Anaerolineae bacterium]
MKRVLFIIFLLFVVPSGLLSAQEQPAANLTGRQIEALPILINARADLELLADTYFQQSGARPDGWITTLDVNDPQLPVFLRLNLEILAGTIFGADERPEGWFGAIFSTPLAIARDLRHDLELVADRVAGAATIRPAGWQGDDPMMRCNRVTQALVTLLGRTGFAGEVDFSLEDACAQLAGQAVQYAEEQLIQPDFGSEATPASSTGSGSILPYRVNNPYTVAFLDRRARESVGAIPLNIGFRPIGRSDTAFSNMMLISGEGFQVYVDYTTTDLAFSDFATLPAVGSDITYCTAAWCG